MTNTFLWTTELAPPSDAQGYLKVEASDGYHTASAVTGPFSVAPKAPLVAILSPTPGSRIPQTAALTLSGLAYAMGPGLIGEDSAYQWSSWPDGPLGGGSQLTVNGLSPGTNQITLTATHERLSASMTVQVFIQADRDGDGLPDEVEALHPSLDPDDPEDAFLDQDGDGLVHSAELLQFGIDPFDPDSDDDGVSDGAEVTQGWAPQTRDMDEDGIVDGQDNCPMVHNPLQEDLDENGIGDACEAESLDRLIITSIQRQSGEEMRIAFRPLPDTLVYKYVLESAPAVDGPWTIREDLPVRRATPPDSFMFVVPPASVDPHQFFRVRMAE